MGEYWMEQHDRVAAERLELQAEVARLAQERDATEDRCTTMNVAMDHAIDERNGAQARTLEVSKKLERERGYVEAAKREIAGILRLLTRAEAERETARAQGAALRAALATIAEQARTWEDSPDPWQAIAQTETCARRALEAK